MSKQRQTKTEARLTSAIRTLYVEGKKESEVNTTIITAHNTVKGFFNVPANPNAMDEIKAAIRTLRQQNKTIDNINQIIDQAKAEVLMEDFYNTRTF